MEELHKKQVNPRLELEKQNEIKKLEDHQRNIQKSLDDIL